MSSSIQLRDFNELKNKIHINNKQEGTPPPVVDITFKDLTYRITKRDGKILDIIKNISATYTQLCAIMGPSGAGKTTLLDMISGNVYGGGKIQGDIYVNKQKTTPKQLRAISCYVIQHPVLLSSATVKESLLTSALLRIPQNIPYKYKIELVDEIIIELGLENCKDVLVGSEKEGIKGISGGEKKRLSVGIELVTRPLAILLDEPTSGLDSEIALSIMSSLKSLTNKGRTVVCSLHQPNSDIVETFDLFHLLASGRTMYYGEWKNTINFFNSCGYKCPKYKNPTDYFMMIAKNKTIAEKITNTFETTQNNNIKITEEVNNLNIMVLKRSDDEISAGWLYQTYVIWIRFMRSWMRHPILFFAEITQYIFTGLFIGAMYYQISLRFKHGISDRLASFFIVLVAILCAPMFGTVNLWDYERILLRMELNHKAYSIFPYFLAKTLSSWPMEFIFSLCFCTSFYFLVGYQLEVTKFFSFWIIVLLFQLISESIGMIAAILTSKLQYAVLTLSLGLLFIFSFTGFIVRDIPIYFKWAQNISYMTIADAALTQIELNGLEFSDPVSGSTIVTGKELISDQRLDDILAESKRIEVHAMLNGQSITMNIIYLMVILVGLRALCFLFLKLAAKYRYL